MTKTQEMLRNIQFQQVVRSARWCGYGRMTPETYYMNNVRPRKHVESIIVAKEPK